MIMEIFAKAPEKFKIKYFRNLRMESADKRKI